MSKFIELIDFLNFNQRNSRIVLFDDLFTNKVIVPFFRDMGFEGLEIIKLKKNQQYALVGRNFFVTKPHIMGSNNPLVIPKVYNLIKQNLNQKCQNIPVKKYKGIYYYRTGRNRRVINDDTVIKELTKIGFYCTSFDDLNYMEAFQLMQQTNLFLGIHGGGLANMMFLPPASVVIEIKNDNPNPNSHCYWHLARSLKFDYTMFVAETVGESNVVEGKGCDLRVDYTKMTDLINSIAK
jgi:capsular polysaccharide biosynthesis protein